MDCIIMPIASSLGRKIDKWYFSHPDASMKGKYRLVIKGNTFTLYPSRGRNAKKPISSLTI